MSPERGMHDPYRHWKSGFAFEVLLYAGFTLAIAAVGFFAWWIFG